MALAVSFAYCGVDVLFFYSGARFANMRLFAELWTRFLESLFGVELSGDTKFQTTPNCPRYAWLNLQVYIIVKERLFQDNVEGTLAIQNPQVNVKHRTLERRFQ